MATNFPYRSFETSSKTKGLEISNRFTRNPQTKHSRPRNLKYNREHIGANPRWHVTDLKASKHDPKAFPSTRYYPSFPTKVFRSVPSSLSLCPFRNGSFVRKPFPFLHRILDSLSTRISLQAARIARKKG